MKLTGETAITYAKVHGKTLNKFTDPTEGPRTNLSIEEAIEIAQEDPNLIWVAWEQYQPITD